MDGQRNEGGLGPVIGTIIILLVIVLGGLYFWGARSRNQEANVASPATTTTTAASDAELQAIGTQSSADDTAAIQADLQNTNVDTLDQSLQSSQ